MRWVLVALLSSATAAQLVSLPPKAERIVEHDWCSSSSYTRAEAVNGVSADALKALSDAAKVARTHPRGCKLAEHYAHRSGPAKFPGGKCPSSLGALGSDRRRAAAAVAATFVGRKVRPVIVGYGSRKTQVRHACGAAVALRTVTVSISLTAMLPSASLSERLVAASRVRGHWRVWLVLH